MNMPLTTIIDSPLPLPVQDHEMLRIALDEADPATLLMVLMHYDPDEALLESFAPFFNSIYEAPKAIPPQLNDELQSRLFKVLTRHPAASPQKPSPELFKKMLSTVVGESVTEEFIPMLKEQMGFEKQVPRLDIPGRLAPRDDFRVLVVGAGMAGLASAIKLREAGYNFVVVDRNPDVGGVWYQATYPGAAVDTPSHFYSFSFELNPDWSHYTPSGPEYKRYLLNVAQKYELRKHIRLNTSAEAFHFDDASQTWRVKISDQDGERMETYNAVMYCRGLVSEWQMPKVPGIENYKGVIMHSAKWDHSVSLNGKRVGQIGTGASGIQIGPRVAEQAEHLTIFQRSRHWCMPSVLKEVPDSVRWIHKHVPFYAEWFRYKAYWYAADGLFLNIQVDPNWPHQERSISQHNDAVRNICLANYEEKLKGRPDLLEKLVPDYPVFGKRICQDVNWLSTLTRDNVTLEDDNLDHFYEDGVVLKDGTRLPLDVVICATGYNLADMTGGADITGRNGRVLKDEWGDDDPRGYLGVTVHGYPNFFLSVGPNSAPNHAGGQNMISEAQVHFSIECLDLIMKNNGNTIEPTEEAQREFHDDIDEQIKHLIWSREDSKSYYKNTAGRNYLSWPKRLLDYWDATRRPDETKFSIR